MSTTPADAWRDAGLELPDEYEPRTVDDAEPDGAELDESGTEAELDESGTEDEANESGTEDGADDDTDDAGDSARR